MAIQAMPELEHVASTDTVAPEAIGGEHLGAHYYRSLRFMGTIAGVTFGFAASYVGYLMPAGILSYINADLGTVFTSCCQLISSD